MASDRDLNVALLRAEAAAVGRFGRGWEMLGATGVRGLRDLNESDGLDRLLSTEWNAGVVPVLQDNVARYSARGASCQRHDAREPVEPAAFDYVDLDPYGGPLPFLDAALAALRPGGLLAVTATDMRVLAGVDPGAASRIYGGRPVRGRQGPEGGLRLLLAAIATRAAEVGREIRPRLSYVGGHHVRAYLRIPSSTRPVVDVGVIEETEWTGPPLGAGAPYGPLWLGPLFDPEIIRRLVAPPTAARPIELERRLAVLREEVAVDRAFTYDANTLAERLHLAQPPSTAGLADALAARGHRLVRSHVRPGAFRTDAPRPTVDEAARSAAQSQNERVRA